MAICLALASIASCFDHCCIDHVGVRSKLKDKKSMREVLSTTSLYFGEAHLPVFGSFGLACGWAPRHNAGRPAERIRGV